MITQIKKYGNSTIIILDPNFMRFYDLKVGNWVDLSDIVKVKKEVKGGVKNGDK